MFVIVAEVNCKFSLFLPSIALVGIELMLLASGNIVFIEFLHSNHFEAAR
jgi:hypothetical protein